MPDWPPFPGAGADGCSPLGALSDSIASDVASMLVAAPVAGPALPPSMLAARQASGIPIRECDSSDAWDLYAEELRNRSACTGGGADGAGKRGRRPKPAAAEVVEEEGRRTRKPLVSTGSAVSPPVVVVEGRPASCAPLPTGWIGSLDSLYTRALACRSCGFVSKTPNLARKHARRRLRRYVCDNQGCGYAAPEARDLERHKQSVHGVCSYECACGGTFSRLDLYERHRKRFPGREHSLIVLDPDAAGRLHRNVRPSGRSRADSGVDVRPPEGRPGLPSTNEDVIPGPVDPGPVRSWEENDGWGDPGG